MAILNEEAPAKAEGNPEKKGIANDAEFIAGMVLTPLYKNPQGIEQLGKVMQSAQDAPATLAHTLFAMVSQARNAILQNKIPVSNKAWVANGGAIDKVIIDVCGLLASTLGKEYLDKEFGKNTKEQLLQIMHEEQVNAGGKGSPRFSQPQETMPEEGGGEEMLPEGPADGTVPEAAPGGLLAGDDEEMV